MTTDPSACHDCGGRDTELVEMMDPLGTLASPSEGRVRGVLSSFWRISCRWRALPIGKDVGALLVVPIAPADTPPAVRGGRDRIGGGPQRAGRLHLGQTAKSPVIAATRLITTPNRPQTAKDRAAGSVGIPPAAPDKARGQARPAQSICGRPQHGNVLVPMCWLKPTSERTARPSAGNIMHLFVRTPVYRLIYSRSPPNQRNSARSLPN